MFDAMITIFNYATDGDGSESWNRSVVRGVQWMSKDRQTSAADGSLTHTREESLTIDFKRTYSENPEYVNPTEYEKLIDKTDCYTLNAIDHHDYIFLGDISDETPKKITDSRKMTELLKQYDTCGIIISCIDNRHMRFLKHIRVVLR